MNLDAWLKMLADEGGSDLYLTTGAPPSAKFQGGLRPLSDELLSPGYRYVGLGAYTVVVLWGTTISSRWELYVLAGMIGLVQGVVFPGTKSAPPES